MNLAAMRDPQTPPQGWVLDFVLHRVERALRQRARYRYVRPKVMREGGGLRIESPCCSRNVDPGGGVIDIALLLPVAAQPAPAGLAGEAQPLWLLHARDHARQCWVAVAPPATLESLLERLCLDPDRVFWP